LGKGSFSCRRRIPIITEGTREEKRKRKEEKALSTGVVYQKRFAALRESTTVSSASDCSIFFWVCTMTFLLVSWSSPFRISSSRRKYACAYTKEGGGRVSDLKRRTQHNRLTYLVKVEDNVKLAHVSKVLVKGLHKSVNDLQRNELIVVVVNRNDKVQTGIAVIITMITLKENKERQRKKERERRGLKGKTDRL